MPQFRSAGLSGYVGKRDMMRPHRRSRFKGKRRFNKKVINAVEKQMLLKQVYSVLTPKQLTAAVNTVGSQSFTTIAIKNSGADVLAIESKIASQVTGINVSANVSEFYVDSYILKLMLKNQEQTNCICDLYEVVPRISTLQDPSTALTDLATQTAGTGVTTSTSWGSTPFQYPSWCEAFKVLRKTRYLLAPGACELIEIRDGKKQKIDLARYRAINASNPSASFADPRYTKYWIMFAMGEPTNDATTVTNVNTSSYKVDIVAREDYHYSFNVNNLSPVNFLTNNLQAIAVNEQEILVETGAKTVPPVQA